METKFSGSVKIPTPVDKPARCAYVTLLTSNEYLTPTLVLNYSLQRAGSKYKLLVLKTANLAPEVVDALHFYGIEMREVEPIGNPAARQHLKNLWRRLRGSMKNINLYTTVYTKLRIWQLYDFNKIVFLDSDMMVLRNPDSLFSAPNWSAVNSGAELAQYKHWVGLNSGLLVVEPSESVFTDMMQKVPIIKSFDRGDQGFIHAYYPNWPTSPELQLPHSYNMPVEFLDQYCSELGYRLDADPGQDEKSIAIVHYWRTHRPWIRPIATLDRNLFVTQPNYAKAFFMWIEAYSQLLRDSLIRPKDFGGVLEHVAKP